MTSPAQVSGPLSGMHGLVPLSQTNRHADPQAVFRQLRAEWGEVAPVELEPGINAWLVMGHEELATVFRYERLYAKDARHWGDFAEGRVKPDSLLGPLMFPRPNAFHRDGDEHLRMRVPIDAALRALPPRKAGRQQITDVCSTLIEGFAGNGRADLIDEYALVVPAIVTGLMLGLDLTEARELHASLMDVVGSGKRTRRGSARFWEILADLVQRGKARPADDLASVLVRHPNFWSDEERVHTLATMIATSAELTMAWIGSTLRLLLDGSRSAGQPGGRRGTRLSIDDALDEVLWREPPLSCLPGRYARHDTVLADQIIRQGEALILGFAAANADPRVHSNDHWSELGNRAHLAWGGGLHTCPAHMPARVIARTAVETALYELPGLRLAVPSGELSWMASPWIRCPARLPVTFSPPAPTIGASQ